MLSSDSETTTKQSKTMNIELSEFMSLISGKTQLTQSAQRDLGIQIVIVDRGFVFAGKTKVDGDFCQVNDAKCIRIWGTKNGLGELVNGPLPTTKCDETGTVLVPMKSVISFIQCNKGW